MSKQIEIDGIGIYIHELLDDKDILCSEESYKWLISQLQELEEYREETMSQFLREYNG